MNLEIINIAANTKNNKDIKNHTHFIKLKNSICGDEIQIKLIIKGEKITNIGYQTDSCIYCQASASLLSKISMNSKKDKIINKLELVSREEFEVLKKIVQKQEEIIQKLKQNKKFKKVKKS